MTFLARLRTRLMFWLDCWPAGLWWATAAITWLTCKVVGHEPITACPCGPSCAWCGADCSPRVDRGRHGGHRG